MEGVPGAATRYRDGAAPLAIANACGSDAVDYPEAEFETVGKTR
jgi:hypothetical protein